MGGVVALAVLLALGAWWLLRRRKRKEGAQVPAVGYHEAGAGVAEERPLQYQMEKGGVHEVPGDGWRREELDANGVRGELNGVGVTR